MCLTRGLTSISLVGTHWQLLDVEVGHAIPPPAFNESIPSRRRGGGGGRGHGGGGGRGRGGRVVVVVMVVVVVVVVVFVVVFVVASDTLVS